MSLIKKTVSLLVTPFVYVFSLLFYHNLLSLKQHLKDSNNNVGVLKKAHIAVYNLRVSKKGSYIGVRATLKDKPIFPHGMLGVFISDGATIGRNCVIYQQVTIGSNTLYGNPHFGSPTIGDNVLIGAGAKIIGKIKVGNNVRIGANAVVARDVPDNCVVVSDGRVIQKQEPLDNRFFKYKNGHWGYIKDGVWVIDNNINLDNI